ncbi:hypothetical protein GTQ34_15660 [Muricauda sp. JGD-17]|uniref:Uncharacterized protein n=1 Tax=Flagellimonas ochracea TaxID=2696472 RepID=A0A964TEI1_9FLAO|nr:BfmA/BtgA family mobilization protein [Allomuricauda ochracea]NAY93347.1 hypothetical protein [Allomuricauda ochracea]
MERFYTIRFKRRTAQRFKQFSKKVGRTYSLTLDTVMDFFEWHGFNPGDRFEKSIYREILKNRKRTEASIAIIRDIEVTQTRPTNAILHALLEQKVKHERPMRVMKKKIKEQPEIEITVPKIRYERLTDKMERLKRESQYVVENVTLKKPSFGKPYLKLEITEGELENYKRTLRNL